jgi:hypothetical protein
MGPLNHQVDMEHLLQTTHMVLDHHHTALHSLLRQELVVLPFLLPRADILLNILLEDRLRLLPKVLLVPHNEYLEINLPGIEFIMQYLCFPLLNRNFSIYSQLHICFASVLEFLTLYCIQFTHIDPY